MVNREPAGWTLSFKLNLNLSAAAGHLKYSFENAFVDCQHQRV